MAKCSWSRTVNSCRASRAGWRCGWPIWAMRRGMLVSTRIINRPGVNAFAAVVGRMPQGLMAVGPGLERFEPGVVPVFIENDDAHLATVQVVAGDQIVPFTLDNLSHSIPRSHRYYSLSVRIPIHPPQPEKIGTQKRALLR